VCDLEKQNVVNEEGQGPLRGYRAMKKILAGGMDVLSFVTVVCCQAEVYALA
jgi:hypothetical protein